MNKMDYNKKMIGKKVSVHETHGIFWIGRVMDVIDDYNLSVSKPDGKTSTVSIYDVRSVADEEKVKK